jgi:hypothetical protein
MKTSPKESQKKHHYCNKWIILTSITVMLCSNAIMKESTVKQDVKKDMSIDKRERKKASNNAPNKRQNNS